VNHVLRRQVSAGRDHGFTSWQSIRMGCFANLFTLGEDLRAADSMDRAIDTAAAEQRRVGGVYDGVDVVCGYVAR
jgi:hypothetical protein